MFCAISYNKSMAWYKDKWLWLILALGAALKTAAFCYVYFCNPLGEQVLIFPDSLTYVYPAQTWLAYGQFWETVSAAPLLLRTPGYPVFLAGVQVLFGNLTWAVAAVQNVLSLALAVAVYLCACEVAGRRAARIAAALTVASVLYFSLSFAVLSEMVCVFLLAWFVYFVLRFLQTQRARELLCAALLLSAAVYVRPAAYYFCAVAGVALIYLRKSAWKKIVLFFCFPLVLCLGAWQLRNHVVSGYGGFSTVNAYNLYFWNADFVAAQQGISIPQAHAQLAENLPADFAQLPAREQVKTYRRLARPWLVDGSDYKAVRAPKWALKTLLGTNFVHTSRLLLGTPADEQEVSFRMLNQRHIVHANYVNAPLEKGLLAVSFASVAAVVLLAVTGGWLLWRRRRESAVFLMVYVLYFWGIGSVFFGAYARFRAPFEFVLCILAGTAVAQGLKNLESLRKRVN